MGALRAAVLAGGTMLALLVPASAAGVRHEGTLLQCRTLTAVDGDTIKCNGVRMRDMGDGAPFVSGYDTPEIQHRKCAAELRLGRVAKTRMAKLLATPGVQVFDSGRLEKGRDSRPLVWVIMPDGRSVGSIMIAEGLARVWTPRYRANWC